MIDLNKWQSYSTVECKIADLPVLLVEKIRVHLFDREEVIHCVVHKIGDSIDVAVISSFHVVSVNGHLQNGLLKAGKKDKELNTSDHSLLLRNYIGLDHYEKSETEFYLTVVGSNTSVGFRFINKVAFQNFTQTLLGVLSKVHAY
jgi:hypothetical protein